MKKGFYFAAAALIAGLTFAGSASASPASAPAQQSGWTQDLSARCRTVVTHRWHHGRRVTVRRNICTHHPRCRTVVTHRWHNGHRVTVRNRAC
jgi:Ni/Co efflux regulator RcnB